LSKSPKALTGFSRQHPLPGGRGARPAAHRGRLRGRADLWPGVWRHRL